MTLVNRMRINILGISLMLTLMMISLTNSSPSIANASLSQDPNATLPRPARTAGPKSRPAKPRVIIRVGIRFVAVVRNDTSRPITYEILRYGSWESFTVAPKYELAHTWIDPVQCICLKYDYKYEDGYQEKKYTLQATKIVGRDPTDSEKKEARVNYFEVDTDGNINVSSKP